MGSDAVFEPVEGRVGLFMLLWNLLNLRPAAFTILHGHDFVTGTGLVSRTLQNSIQTVPAQSAARAIAGTKKGEHFARAS